MTSKTGPPASDEVPRTKRLAAARLDALIEEAIVDAYGESEQTTGFFTMLGEHLAMPFTTEVLGMEVIVEQIDMPDEDPIVAVCGRGTSRQRIAITELPVPATPPKGWEWIEAYRRWRARGGR